MSKKVFFATGALAILGGLATAISTSSCDQLCTMEAHPSVEVTLYTSTGQKYSLQGADSVTWWKVDPSQYGEAPDPAILPPAGALQDAECTDAVCSSLIAGYEEEGLIEVRANVCGSEYIERIEVPLTEDGCHVETQQLDLSIDETNCDPVQTPSDGVLTGGCSGPDHFSVIVDAYTKVPGGVVPVKPDVVYGLWQESETSAQQIPISGLCLDPECMTYGVGMEQTGYFEIQVHSCGNVFGMPVQVEKLVGSCHVHTEHVSVEIDPALCATTGDDDGSGGGSSGPQVDGLAQPVPTVCDLKSRPSAIVSTVKSYGDYVTSVPVKNMWYSTTGERRQEAVCIESGADERCSRWVAGYEIPGRMSIASQYCGEAFGTDISVPMTEDGCHVETQYVMLEPPTIGCFDSEPTPPEPPPPPPVDGEPER